jgi:hypothetical protein
MAEALDDESTIRPPASRRETTSAKRFADLEAAFTGKKSSVLLVR